MRLMILSTFVLAGLATGVFCYPPLKERIAAVVLAQPTASAGNLASSAVGSVTKQAADLRRSAEAAAADLMGSRSSQTPAGAAPKTADHAAQPGPPPAAAQAVQRKS